MSFSFMFSSDDMISPVNMKICNNPLNKVADESVSKSKNFDIFGNFILWTAQEAGADCWAEEITSVDSNSSNNIHEVHFGFDPGYRLGIGYKMKHDQWNTKLYYTWFRTRGRAYISGATGAVHSTFLGNFYVDNPIGLGLSGPAYQKAGIIWKIHFNMLDWDLGRKFCAEKPVVIELFLGVKGGWIDQAIYSTWQNPNLSIFFEPFKIGRENIENNYWGIGPKAGINTKWNLYNSKSKFYLLGNFSEALMWGNWSFVDEYKNDISQQVSIDLQNIRSGSSMMQTFMGVGWENNIRHDRCRFSVKLGYEMQFWLDQLQFYSFTGGRLVNMLTLQGGTLELYFDF